MSSVATPAAWTACLDAFARELTPQQFVTWIQPLACRHEGKGLTLTAPNRFVLQWVRDRFGPRIVALATQASGAPVNVEYAVADAAAAAPIAAAPGAQAAVPASSPATQVPVDSSERPGVAKAQPIPVAAPLPAVHAVPKRSDSTSLNPTFTFASFVAGKANQLARAAGHAGRRAPDVVQPAVRLRRRGPRQDAPDPGDRQPHPGRAIPARRSATSTPRPTSRTSCARTSTRRSTISSATTARSTCCSSTTSSSSAARAARRKSSSISSTR